MIQNQTTIMNEMRLVGNLQDYGRPYASLFIDTENNALYIFVRINSGANNSSSYIAIPTSADEVKSYMDQTTTLSSLVKEKPSSEAIIQGNQVVMNLSGTSDAINGFHDENVFDPEFCHDKMKLKVFLRRYKSGTYNIQISQPTS